MKLFLQLAVIAAFACPVFAHAASGDVSQPTLKVADDAAPASTPKKKKKGSKKKAKPAADAAPADSK